MAEITGIGKLGRNGLIYHPKYGSRLMFGGVVTSVELPQTAFPKTVDTGCPEGCYKCTEACPVEAIDRMGNVDRKRCLKQSMTTPLLSMMAKTGMLRFDQSDPVEKQRNESLFNAASVDGNSIYHCMLCVSACPSG